MMAQYAEEQAHYVGTDLFIYLFFLLRSGLSKVKSPDTEYLG